MTKLISVVTKKIWDPWIHPVMNETSDGYIPNEYFTQEEIDNVLMPFLNYVRTQVGFDPNSVVKNISGNESVTIREFDTLDHAKLAAINIGGIGPNPDPVVVARNELLRQKTEAANVTYTYSTKII